MLLAFLLSLQIIYISQSANSYVGYGREWKNCDDMPCVKGFRCEMKTSGPVKGPICVKTQYEGVRGPCTAKCMAGNKCVWVDDENCVRKPCRQHPGCAPIDEVNPCAFTSCLTGCDCIVVDGEGKCVAPGTTPEQWKKQQHKYNDCNPPCKAGYECKSTTINCIRAPCPQPQPHCIKMKIKGTRKDNNYKPNVPATVNYDKDQKCTKGDVWDECGGCEGTCEMPDVVCAAVCRFDQAGCRCRYPTVRGPDGTCINHSKCDNPGKDAYPTPLPYYTASTPHTDDICALTDCRSGLRCHVIKGEAVCLPNETGSIVNGETGTTIPIPSDQSKRMYSQCQAARCPRGKMCHVQFDQADCVSAKPNSCKYCHSSQICALQVVQCFAPPCHPIPICLGPIEQEQPTSGCAALFCDPNKRCEETATGAKCVHIISCANVRCPGVPCVDTPEGPRCQSDITTRKPYGSSSPKPSQECGLNEKFDECGNNCEHKCTEIEWGPPPCILSCGPPACVCEEGTLRDDNTGACVEPRRCTFNALKPPSEQSPNKCGVNEFLNACGSRCEESCEDALSGQPKACVLICDPPACVCNKGFYRKGKGGKCVSKQECQGKGSGYVLPSSDGEGSTTTGLVCGPNEEISLCGNLCEGKCEHVGKGGIPCVEICAPRACACKKGFYRNGEENIRREFHTQLPLFIQVPLSERLMETVPMVHRRRGRGIRLEGLPAPLFPLRMIPPIIKETNESLRMPTWNQ